MVSSFLVELMVEHVYNMSQFGFMMSFNGVSFVVFYMVRPISSYCDPTRVLDVEDGQFPT